MLALRLLILAVFLIQSPAWCQETVRIGITDSLPYRLMPIDYFGEKTDDAVAGLNRRLFEREVTLTHREASGYLLDLLKELEIPVESQMLVFSRTSVHQRFISPKTPRAIYFNDEVSVGWVPGAPVLEVAAHDPIKGAMFYTLSQSPPEKKDSNPPLELLREERCITCHVSTATLNVPGHLLRSFIVNDRGEPQNGFSPVTQATSFEKRWGGWFVTGKSDGLIHMGNLFGPKDAARHEQDSSFRGTVSDLSPLVDLTKYPSGASDIVALLVLQHQLQFYNLVTRVQYEYQFDRHSDAEEQLARYALMHDEAELSAPVTGSTSFSKWYQSIGPRDGEGRSLRDLDLTTKLFRHNLSPLIRSRSFESLHGAVKERLWKRFREARGDWIE